MDSLGKEIGIYGVESVLTAQLQYLKLLATVLEKLSAILSIFLFFLMILSRDLLYVRVSNMGKH